MRVYRLSCTAISGGGIPLIITLILLLSKISNAGAQDLEKITPDDTLSILHNRVNVILKSGTFEVIKQDQLLKAYSASFNLGKILYTDGFKIGENSKLTFYQTNIENREINDGGLSTWKLIASFTDKIPQNHWLESGWSRMTNGALMYFVKLVSDERPEQFSKFVFYYIDNKLSFSLFQCPVQTLAINPGEPEKYLSVVANHPHHARFTGNK